MNFRNFLLYFSKNLGFKVFSLENVVGTLQEYLSNFFHFLKCLEIHFSVKPLAALGFMEFFLFSFN